MESINTLDKGHDIVIIGAGIIGVSLSIEIAKRDRSLSILVIEKEEVPGTHASGRNSGVIHAGFYYSPESLKAKFCKDGNVKLRVTCAELGVPIRNTGKVVLSQDESQVPLLEKLFKRGIENGVEIEILHNLSVLTMQQMHHSIPAIHLQLYTSGSSDRCRFLQMFFSYKLLQKY